MIEKYAVPFNGADDIHNYIKLIKDRSNHIDYIYMIIDELFNEVNKNYTNLCNTRIFEKYISNNKKLLESDIDIPIFIETTNNIYNIGDHSNKLDMFYTLITNLLSNYNISGFIISNSALINSLKSLNTNIIYKGTNNVKAILNYNKYMNINKFILPPQSLRDSLLVNGLKWLNKQNITLQAYINNSCYYGCLDTYDCYTNKVTKSTIRTFICCTNRLSDEELCRNYILPRWVNKFSEFINTFIIEGLYEQHYERIISILDKYIEYNDNCKLSEITNVSYSKNLNVSKIPDKLLYCMNNCCDCDVCNNLLKNL